MIAKKTKEIKMRENTFLGWIDNIRLSSGVFLSYAGVMVAALLPLTIFLLQDSTILDIDYLIIMDKIINLRAVLFDVVILATISLFLAIVDALNCQYTIIRCVRICLIIVALIDAFELGAISYKAISNSFDWLYDIPATSNNLPSNTSVSGSIDKKIDMSDSNKFREETNGILRDLDANYRNNARLHYILYSDDNIIQESRWAILWNDSKSYDVLAKKDFELFSASLISFLGRLDDDNESTTNRGFELLNAHIPDIFAINELNANCNIIQPILSQFNMELSMERKEHWNDVVGKYIEVGVGGIKNDSNAKCWFDALAHYIVAQPTIIDDEKIAEFIDYVIGIFNKYSDDIDSVIDAASDKYKQFYEMIKSGDIVGLKNQILGNISGTEEEDVFYMAFRNKKYNTFH